MIRGPRSRAGLIAYPVGPPSDRPMPEHEQGDEQAGRGGRRRPLVGEEREHAEDENERPDDLGADVGRGVADRRRRAEDRELEARILRRTPVIDVRDPDERRADEGADELAREVLGDLIPFDGAGDREAHGDRRVQMRPAELRDREHADHHGHAPNRT